MFVLRGLCIVASAYREMHKLQLPNTGSVFAFPSTACRAMKTGLASIMHLLTSIWCRRTFQMTI